MKSLAAVNIRVFEKAAEAAGAYAASIEQGFQAVIKASFAIDFPEDPGPAEPALILVFGSEQGMCGNFNESIARHLRTNLGDIVTDPRLATVFPIGTRVRPHIEAVGGSHLEPLEIANALGEVPELTERILFRVESERRRRGIDRVFTFGNRQASRTSFDPHHEQYVPVPSERMAELEAKPWATKQIPFFRMQREPLIERLVEQYLFIQITEAILQSQAAENAARLAAMQAAESNINERLDELRGKYNQQRQAEITAEMLDIASGFEALRFRRRN
jgi:F-type H+-transporting ATPase subunit gamma